MALRWSIGCTTIERHMDPKDLNGKTALVTGASRGIGRGICLGLAEKGANVVATARSADAQQALRSEVESHGNKALVIGCDLESEENIVAMVEQAREEFGKVDILVCSAGVLFESTVAETSTEDWDNLMNVNLRSVFITIRECLRVMPEKGGSKILIISSNSGKWGQVGLSAYCASKFVWSHGSCRLSLAGAQGNRDQCACRMSWESAYRYDNGAVR